MFSFDCAKLIQVIVLFWGFVLFPSLNSFAQTEKASSKSIEPQHVSLRPYRVRIDISYDPKASLTSSDHLRIQSQLAQMIERSVGEKWKLKNNATDQTNSKTAIGIYQNNWLALSSSEGLQRLQPVAILNRYPDFPFDKLFLIAIEPKGIGYQVSGREFDSLSQRLGSVSIENTFEKSFLGDTIFHSLLNVFSPVVSIESVIENQVTVSEQASQYLTPDPILGMSEKDVYFTPFFRYLNRNREVKNIQFIPWTYLILEEMNRKYATCSLSSGLRGILSGSRRRVETLAIRVKPQYPQTNLALIPRGKSTQSYAGMRVQLSPLNPQEVRQRQIAAKKQKEQTKKPVTKPLDYITEQYLTNRSGKITLQTDPKQPLVWLYVRSGKALVANVPYIPGIDRDVSIQVPDDRIRLNVEGELAVLNGELIEAVASLSMKMARIRKWAKNNEWTKVNSGIKKLESEISPKQIFQEKLNVIQVTAVEAAQKQNNRAAQSRIASLCRDTASRIDRFLDPTGIIDFKTEIQDLRQLQEQAPKR
ncbi:hypothetical protein V144x_26740 [Gimesia aquarii]|uniref:Uncharacterized protein n=2 Tax=Gimesia aquarii TaxID=2527964 RepID=A0A517VW20_9PLAN|nr:hypothetical protein V144x_26740 [Gimesia aquarii]